MNVINQRKIVKSIEMKDKWLKNIFKKSRKLSSLDKFWNLVIEELGFFYFNDFNSKYIFISDNFLKELKEADTNNNNEAEYNKYSPKTHKEINDLDYSIYITEGYKRT